MGTVSMVSVSRPGKLIRAALSLAGIALIRQGTPLIVRRAAMLTVRAAGMPRRFDSPAPADLAQTDCAGI